VNQADLGAVYLNSRNAVVALKTEQKERVRVQDVSALDGTINARELPEHLKGFKDIYEEGPGSTKKMN
jgi:hypothetical protein